MGEPTQGVPFFDWLGRHISIIIPALIALFGGMFALTDRYKKSVAKQLIDSRADIDREFSNVWSQMRNHISVQNVQGSDIAVLKADQRNTTQQLQDIKETTHATNQKIDGLTDKLTAVLLEMRRER